MTPGHDALDVEHRVNCRKCRRNFRVVPPTAPRRAPEGHDTIKYPLHPHGDADGAESIPCPIKLCGRTYSLDGKDAHLTKYHPLATVAGALPEGWSMQKYGDGDAVDLAHDFTPIPGTPPSAERCGKRMLLASRDLIPDTIARHMKERHP